MPKRQLSKLWRKLLTENEIPRHYPTLIRLGLRGVYRRARPLLGIDIDPLVFERHVDFMIEAARKELASKRAAR
jgi:hypothetical protein